MRMQGAQMNHRTRRNARATINYGIFDACRSNIFLIVFSKLCSILIDLCFPLNATCLNAMELQYNFKQQAPVYNHISIILKMKNQRHSIIEMNRKLRKAKVIRNTLFFFHKSETRKKNKISNSLFSRNLDGELQKAFKRLSNFSCHRRWHTFTRIRCDFARSFYCKMRCKVTLQETSIVK